MNNNTLLIGLALVFAGNASALTLTGTNLIDADGTDWAVVDNTGAAIVPGSGIAAMGYFATLDDATVMTSTISDFPALLADFVILGQDTFLAEGLSTEGLYSVNVSNGNPNPGDTVSARFLYTFLGNSSQLSTSTDIGLFRNNVSLVPTGQDPVSYVLNMPSGGVSVLGSELTHAKVAIDATNLGLGSSFMTDTYTLVTVPEPSSTALLGLGMVGFIIRRRR